MSDTPPGQDPRSPRFHAHLTVKQVVVSAGFYPITGLYLGAVATATFYIQGGFNLVTAFIVFGLMAVVAVIIAAWRELRAVHLLVNSQRTELLQRIDQLTTLLADQGVQVPPESQKQQQARREAARQVHDDSDMANSPSNEENGQAAAAS